MLPISNPAQVKIVEIAIFISGVLLALWYLWIAIRPVFQRWPARACPRCAYDMIATVGLTCPECGHVAASEAEFASHPIRRHYLFFAAILACGLSYAASPQIVIDFGLPVLIFLLSLALFWFTGLSHLFCPRTVQTTDNHPPKRRFYPLRLVLALLLMIFPLWVLGFCFHCYQRAHLPDRWVENFKVDHGVGEVRLNIQEHGEHGDPGPDWAHALASFITGYDTRSSSPPNVSRFDPRIPVAEFILRFSCPSNVYRQYWHTSKFIDATVNDATPSQVRALARCPVLYSLTFISPDSKSLFTPSDYTAQDLVDFEHQTAIHEIYIQHYGFPKDATVHLFTNKPNLVDVQLYGAQVDDSSLIALGKGSPNLQSLCFDRAAPITSAGLNGLAPCTKLQVLELPISREIPSFEGIKNLEFLEYISLTLPPEPVDAQWCQNLVSAVLKKNPTPRINLDIRGEQEKKLRSIFSDTLGITVNNNRNVEPTSQPAYTRPTPPNTTYTQPTPLSPLR